MVIEGAAKTVPVESQKVKESAAAANGGSPFEGRYQALLFDMDGTVVHSHTCSERVWGAWAIDHGLDVEAFLPTIRGVRSVDTIAALQLPGINPEVEAERITNAEIASTDGIVEIAGAANFLRSLPAGRWAVVTSAPVALATARLKAAGLPLPRVLVTSEDVTVGKPNPECYEIAAQRLGVEAKECLVFEDAAAGILAAEAAGARVIVVASAHVHSNGAAHTTIPDYEKLIARVDDEGFIRVAHDF